MNIDWKRNNKIGIRNFTEATDLHDVVKLMIVRMLRKKYPDSTKVPIYTESKEKDGEFYPDIKTQISGNLYFWEIQKDINDYWIKKMNEQYNDYGDWFLVDLSKVKKEWEEKLFNTKSKKKDPLKLLRGVLNKYIV